MLSEGTAHLEMRRRMLVPWLAAVIVAPDPRIPVRIKLVLVGCLLHLHAIPTLVWLAKENDEYAQESLVPQPHHVLIPYKPAFNDHSIGRARASSHTSAGTGEYCEAQQEIYQTAEGSERVGAPCKVLPR